MDLPGPGDEAQPGFPPQQLRGHPQILPLSVLADLPALLGGLGPQVEGGVVVAGEKGGEAAGVVIVAVGEDGGVGPGQVRPQPGGVFQQSGGGPGVQQAAPAVLLDEKGETVLTAQAGVGGGVLDQRGDFHPKALLSQGESRDPASPHPSGLRPATFPPQGGRSGKRMTQNLPPSRGKVSWPAAMTDEGELGR